MEPDHQIEIWLQNSLVSAEDITRLLGIDLGTAFFVGENKKIRDRESKNIWSVYSDPHGVYVEDQWASLFQKFGDKWGRFVEIAKNGSAHITIVVDATDRIPPIIIPPAMSFAAAEINAVIDIDYYR